MNNREFAIVFWLIIISFYILTSEKMVEVKTTLNDLVSAFFVRQIVSVLFLMIIYMGGVVYALSEVDLWNIEQVKNTVFWCASVGFMSLFKLESIKRDTSFFKHSVIDNLKLLVILQFIVGVYTFPLLLEVALVPILALIGAMLAIADSDKKYILIKKFLEYVLSGFGLIVIAFTLFNLATNFGEIGKEKTLYNFLVPPLLTLFYLPFIFVMMVYSTYEQASIRLKFAINNKILRCLAMVYAVVVFNVRLTLLERWSNQISRAGVQSHSDLIDSFEHLFKVRKAELKPIDVPYEKGWSPYKAKDFLSSEGLKTGFYNKLFGEWFASSPMVEVGDTLIRDNIAYYVEGSEKIATTLKIVLSVNDSSRSNIAQERLLDLSDALSKMSLNQALSHSMKSAILNGEEYSELHGSKKLTIQKETWPEHKFNGYDAKFIVSSI